MSGHVAVAIDRQIHGVRFLGELHTVATTHGYGETGVMYRTVVPAGLGEIHAFGIEGTWSCSYGAGVARFLTSRGHPPKTADGAAE